MSAQTPVATIPFQLYDQKFVLIQLGVNGSEPLTFYFDTGASAALLDAEVAETLGIQPNFTQEIPGASGAKTYHIALGNEVHIAPDIIIPEVALVLEDLSRLRQSTGIHYDGIIGYNIIEPFITRVSFEEGSIFLYDKAEQINPEGYTTLGFEFYNEIPIPQFDLTITLHNGEQYTDRVFFDSGAGLTLLVNSPFSDKTQLVEKIGKTLGSRGDNLSDASISLEGAIASLSIDTFLFPEMPVRISTDKAGVSSFENYLGILGSEIINRFDFILDYEAMQLHLKPNHLYPLPFDFPLSGIKLKADRDKIIVLDVSPDDPAYREGLRSGDIIVSMNGVQSSDVSVYRAMLRKEGETVSITTDDGKVISFQLVRLI